MNAKYNTRGAIDRVAKVGVVDLKVLQKPALLHQGTFKCIDECGRRSTIAVDTKGVKVTASLAVTDDLCLELPTMLVLRRCNPADGAVDNIPYDAKFNTRRDGFYHILHSTNNLRTPCKVAEESTAVDGSVCGKGDIKWESIPSNSQEEMPCSGAIHLP